ncbi:hypothetical protein [Brockia lithotrophica]|nr:hypothetical protein [Brockia lithotrophica]
MSGLPDGFGLSALPSSGGGPLGPRTPPLSVGEADSALVWEEFAFVLADAAEDFPAFRPLDDPPSEEGAVRAEDRSAPEKAKEGDGGVLPEYRNVEAQFPAFAVVVVPVSGVAPFSSAARGLSGGEEGVSAGHSPPLSPLPVSGVKADGTGSSRGSAGFPGTPFVFEGRGAGAAALPTDLFPLPSALYLALKAERSLEAVRGSYALLEGGPSLSSDGTAPTFAVRQEGPTPVPGDLAEAASAATPDFAPELARSARPGFAPPANPVSAPESAPSSPSGSASESAPVQPDFASESAPRPRPVSSEGPSVSPKADSASESRPPDRPLLQQGALSETALRVSDGSPPSREALLREGPLRASGGEPSASADPSPGSGQMPLSAGTDGVSRLALFSRGEASVFGRGPRDSGHAPTSDVPLEGGEAVFLSRGVPPDLPPRPPEVPPSFAGGSEVFARVLRLATSAYRTGGGEAVLHLSFGPDALFVHVSVREGRVYLSLSGSSEHLVREFLRQAAELEGALRQAGIGFGGFAHVGRIDGDSPRRRGDGRQRPFAQEGALSLSHAQGGEGGGSFRDVLGAGPLPGSLFG